jgi:hypothetical protein
MKTVFKDIEHDSIREKIVTMGDACLQISEIIQPNPDLAVHLVNVMEELKEFSMKMRDKYAETEEDIRVWKKCRPYLKDV